MKLAPLSSDALVFASRGISESTVNVSWLFDEASTNALNGLCEVGQPGQPNAFLRMEAVGMADQHALPRSLESPTNGRKCSRMKKNAELAAFGVFPFALIRVHSWLNRS